MMGPPHKFGLFEHGGVTRKMLTIEIGRAAKRDHYLTSEDAVLQSVKEWLQRNRAKTNGRSAESTLSWKDVIEAVACPSCGRPAGERCYTLKAQGGSGMQFPTTTHKTRIRAANEMGRAGQSDGTVGAVTPGVARSS